MDAIAYWLLAIEGVAFIGAMISVVWFAKQADTRLDRLIKEHKEAHEEQLKILGEIRDFFMKRAYKMDQVHSRIVNGDK